MLASLCLAILTLAPVDTPAPSDPVFAVVAPGGKSVRGRIRGFGSRGEIRMVAADDTEFTRQIESVFQVLRVDPVVVPSRPEGGVLVFPKGDILYRATVGTTNDAGLQINSLAFGLINVPLDATLGAVLNPPPDLEKWESLISRLRVEPRDSEVVWLANGDRQSGGLLAVEESTVAMQINGKRVNFDRPGVYGLGFDPTLVNYPKPKGAFWELSLTDGSRLGISSPRIEGGQIVAMTRFGVAIRVSQAEVFKFTAIHPQVSWLSDREASATVYTPYVGPVRPYVRDRAVDGGSLRMGGQAFDRGLGTQGRTRLAYRLSPGDLRLQASVGVDDRAGPLGSVRFRVWLDRTAIFTSEVMAAGDPPLWIDIELGDAKVLILETDFGTRGNVRDFADWANARLIRAPQPGLKE